jgi:hypothetical protein|tara:strand:- start:3082 stop:3711 length:630 start_codon:yes stop_codon:yes gene_type:complete
MSNSKGKHMIQYCRGLMKKDTCKLILHKFRQKETSEIEQDGDIALPNEELRDDFKYRDKSGRLVWSITPNSPNFDYFCEKIMPLRPEHVDFEFVSYVSVMEYPTGTFIPMHTDSADEYDTATAIITLDEDFTGGTLVVDDTVFKTKTGDMIMFNHSNNVYHGTTPVKSGIRTVIGVWFQTEFSHKPFEEELEEIQPTEMKSEKTFNALL